MSQDSQPSPLGAVSTSSRYTEFRKAVAGGWFIDYDGQGHASNGTHIDPTRDIYPSTVGEVPPDATHIVWYNR